MEDFQIVIIALCVFSPCFICVCFWVCICFPSGNSPSAPSTDNSQFVPTTNSYPSTGQQTLPQYHQIYGPNAVTNVQQLNSVPPFHDLATSEDLPPSYDEVTKQDSDNYP